jgi:hypothetical protein
MQIVIGTVTDTEPSSYEGKDGKVINQFNVWISDGRKMLKTTGPDLDADYQVGEQVVLRIEPRSFRNTDEISARRVARYPSELVPDLMAMFGQKTPES